LTTFFLSFVNAGLLKGDNDVFVVLGLALFYGGLAQLLAGMWEFKAGNTFGATAFSSYGAFWLSFAALLLPSMGGAALLKGVDTAIGIYLLGWTIFTGILMLASFRTNAATALVFVLLFITFLLLALGKLQGSDNMTMYGGYFGIATAIMAWYVAMAGVLSGVSNGKISLPVFPLSAA
jgi:succinate-acetate transporter protein